MNKPNRIIALHGKAYYRAHDAGAAAAHSGVDRNDNPYTQSSVKPDGQVKTSLRWAWLDGFESI